MLNSRKFKVLAALTCFWFVSTVSNPVFAGFCRGDQAPLRHRLESWAQGARRLKHGFEAQAALWLRWQTASWALWHLHWEARIAIDQTLTLQGSPEQLCRTMVPFFSKAWRIRERLLGNLPPFDEEALSAVDGLPRRLGHELVEAMSLCQALRQRAPDVCAPLGRPDQRRICALLSARLAILYAGHCERSFLEGILEVEKLPLEYLRDACRVLRDGPPAACDGLRFEEFLALQRCRAIAGQGESACLDPRLAPAESRSCLTELNQARLARGLPTTGDEEQGLHGIARRVLQRPDLSCLDVALAHFDGEAAGWFMLEAFGPVWWPAP